MSRLIDIEDHRLTDHERHIMRNAAERLTLRPAVEVVDPDTGRSRGFLVLVEPPGGEDVP